MWPYQQPPPSHQPYRPGYPSNQPPSVTQQAPPQNYYQAPPTADAVAQNLALAAEQWALMQAPQVSQQYYQEPYQAPQPTYAQTPTHPPYVQPSYPPPPQPQQYQRPPPFQPPRQDYLQNTQNYTQPQTKRVEEYDEGSWYGQMDGETYANTQQIPQNVQQMPPSYPPVRDPPPQQPNAASYGEMNTYNNAPRGPPAGPPMGYPPPRMAPPPINITQRPPPYRPPPAVHPYGQPLLERPPAAVYPPAADPYSRPVWVPPAQPPGYTPNRFPPPETAVRPPVPEPYYNYSLEGNLEYREPETEENYEEYTAAAYPNFDFESVAQSHSAEAIKKLPPWIRDGLEKLEREKQKEREKQRFMQKYESSVRGDTGNGDDGDKSPGGGSGRSSPRSRSGSAVEMRSVSRSPSPFTPEERQRMVLQATKDMVTAILMQSTGMVLEKACAEEIEARKAALKQATVKPVKKSAALAALAQFGSSESDSDGENTKDASGLPPPPPGVLKKLATAQKAVEPVITIKKESSPSKSRSPSPIEKRSLAAPPVMREPPQRTKSKSRERLIRTISRRSRSNSLDKSVKKPVSVKTEDCKPEMDRKKGPDDQTKKSKFDNNQTKGVSNVDQRKNDDDLKHGGNKRNRRSVSSSPDRSRPPDLKRNRSRILETRRDDVMKRRVSRSGSSSSRSASRKHDSTRRPGDKTRESSSRTETKRSSNGKNTEKPGSRNDAAVRVSAVKKEDTDKKSEKIREVSRGKTVNQKDDPVRERERKVSRNDDKKSVDKLAERPKTDPVLVRNKDSIKKQSRADSSLSEDSPDEKRGKKSDPKKNDVGKTSSRKEPNVDSEKDRNRGSGRKKGEVIEKRKDGDFRRNDREKAPPPPRQKLQSVIQRASPIKSRSPPSPERNRRKRYT